MWQRECTWFFVLFHQEFRPGNRIAFEVLMSRDIQCVQSDKTCLTLSHGIATLLLFRRTPASGVVGLPWDMSTKEDDDGTAKNPPHCA